MNRLAKILWEAWETQFRKGGDQPALDWDLIPPEIQACWVAVAAACQQREDWQPIETAPKDKTPVMVFDKNHDNGKMAVAVWENDEHYIIEEQSIPIGIFPTHWMPLPEPPR